MKTMIWSDEPYRHPHAWGEWKMGPLSQEGKVDPPIWVRICPKCGLAQARRDEP